MVFKNYVGVIIKTVWNLGYLYECARKQNHNNIRIPVKQEGYLLTVLNEIEVIFEALTQVKNDEILKKNHEEIKSWIKYFEKNYVEKYFQTKPSNLTLENAKELEKDSFSWYENLINLYSEPATKLLLPQKYEEEVKSLEKIVGKKVALDLNDAFLCLGNGIATPAVMIMNRVAEFMVRKLYKKMINRSPPDDATWGMLERDLKLKMGEKDPIIGLLQHRRGKRNLSQHPGEQYSLREAEQNFFYVQELIVEINKRIKKKSLKR